MRAPIILSILAAAGSSSALPNPDARFREGANHHLGDDSFVTKHARAPGEGDTEKARMKDHLAHIRGLLAAGAPTRPALAARRAELLGYLDDYIARGITPTNAHLPWRTPVFIDDQGAICAVGYLIERSVGRALPERIAREHRYDFLEDIAEMPEVRAWVETSGFTLDELASIQPAYASPNIETWRTWDLVRHAPKDGAFELEMSGWGSPRKVAGTFLKRSLHGEWTVKDVESSAVIGVGKLERGRGTWKSFYNDGKRVLATGEYANNKAHGAWTFFHPSGNVAAVGRMTNGMRTGEWSFFYDTSSKTPIARGVFAASGAVTGAWQHFDPNGKLLATTSSANGVANISITADERGVTEQVNTFLDPTSPVESLRHRLEKFTLGAEIVYVEDSGYTTTERVWDPTGALLVKGDKGWTSANCHWPKKRQEIAASGDTPWLHTLLHKDSRTRATVKTEYGVHTEEDKGLSTTACDAPRAVTGTRSAKLDTILASRQAIRAPTPAFLRLAILGQELEDNLVEPVKDSDDTAEDAQDPVERQRGLDLRSLLATDTVSYIEWTHVDGRFTRVFRTLAGHYSWEWHSSEHEADGTDPLQNAQR